MLGRLLHKVARRAKRIVQRCRRAKTAFSQEWLYAHSRSQCRLIHRAPQVQLAVVLHLYYPEMWPIFAQALAVLDDVAFDLFITVPSERLALAQSTVATRRQVHFFQTPNRGRDVLPFIKLAPILDRLGYSSVLKLHSKKSTHWTGGEAWLRDILQSLLPTAQEQIQRLLKLMDEPDTAIVGPAAHYVALPVNYPANRWGLLSILGDVCPKGSADTVDANVDQYGFFGGTMFWARLQAIRPIFAHSFKVKMFEPEEGQIDGTMAHAIERAFCIVPELFGQKIYGSTGSSVELLEYASGMIPEWSDLHPARARA